MARKHPSPDELLKALREAKERHAMRAHIIADARAENDVRHNTKAYQGTCSLIAEATRKESQ